MASPAQTHRSIGRLSEGAGAYPIGADRGRPASDHAHRRGGVPLCGRQAGVPAGDRAAALLRLAGLLERMDEACAARVLQAISGTSMIMPDDTMRDIHVRC